MQNDFQVVNHQIEDDADVGAAVRIGREPVGLDESRIRQAFFQRAQDRIEALDVADLEDEATRRGQFRQLAGMRGVIRDRFFHEQMFAAREQLPRNFEMRAGRRGDRRGIDLLGKLVDRRYRLDAELGRALLRDGAVRVVNRGELRARDLGIDLAQVKTASDRVRHSDLDAYLLYNGGTVAARGAAAARADETIKVVGLRRKIAENMQEAKRRIPHFTLVEEYDVTALEDTRAMMNRDRGSNPKLTLLPFLITAMARAAAEWPMLNATYDDDANVITRHGAVHMGIATQTPNGLMVPVIRNAQAMSVWQLANEILRLAEAARSGKAARDELMGSTITISSLGPMGGVTSTPVINRPEVAILAVNKVEEKLVPVDADIEVRKRMNLSLSCDHRVVDGWDAANFMQTLKAYIENPLRLLSA